GSRDVYVGIAQDQALNAIDMAPAEAESRLQELHSRNNEYARKICELVAKRTELMKGGKPLNGVLDALFQLKEEQRRIRHEVEVIEKATNILNLSPCIIDYAVNFGMLDTEKQWCRHLLKSDSLTSPVYFNQSLHGETRERLINDNIIRH
ncbi:MAG: hypothetical protein M3247_00865, partial [Thermoproteota archaeon]|nr:hypothetical protein [Thermoproteota archaeon]